MKIIKQRISKLVTNYQLSFQAIGYSKGTGLGFECDKDGNVDLTKLQPAGLANYHIGMRGEGYEKPEVVEFTNRFVECAIGKCDACGRHVHLSHSDNDCDCGAIYNLFGQRLAPREQWGEETGESFV